MACGTPVVSFGVGGVLDLVRPGLTGYLAEVENADDLSYGIAELLENETLRRKMGENGRRMAVEEYNEEFVVQQHIQLYQSVVQRFCGYSDQSLNPLNAMGRSPETYPDF